MVTRRTVQFTWTFFMIGQTVIVYCGKNVTFVITPKMPVIKTSFKTSLNNIPFISSQAKYRNNAFYISKRESGSSSHCCYVDITLGGDKLGMSNYTCPHKPLRKINCPSAITRLKGHVSYDTSDLMICDHEK